MAKTIKVVDVSSADAINEEEEVEQVEQVEQVKSEEEVVSEARPEVEPDEKRTIKTVELFECEKCGKKLTARTLKYAHPSKCPYGDGKPSRTQTQKPVKPEKKQAEPEPAPKPILTAYEQRMLRIRERQDKIRELASQAF